jgi:hypothetical protein
LKPAINKTGLSELKTTISFFLLCAGILACSFGNAQPVTGDWKGKIDHRNV